MTGIKGQHLKEGIEHRWDETVAAPVVVEIEGKRAVVFGMQLQRGDCMLAPNKAADGQTAVVLFADWVEET